MYSRSSGSGQGFGYSSLTTLRDKPIELGAEGDVKGRYTAIRSAELAVPREPFREIWSLIVDLQPRHATP